MTPESPPMMNMAMKPRANSIGVDMRSRPPQVVPIQLKIFTPVGTAMIMVEAKPALATGPSPVANMWWAQTLKPRKPMATPEKTTNA